MVGDAFSFQRRRADARRTSEVVVNEVKRIRA